MKDVLEVIQNIQGIYESDTAFTVLKDFERVLDELDLYCLLYTSDAADE